MLSLMRKLAGILGLVAALAFAPSLAWADAEITTANSSEDAETESGDASGTNHSTGIAGMSSGEVQAQDIDDVDAENVQEGDNDVDTAQSANASTGDTVGGQVIGAVSDGELTVDATNSSEDVDATSGDADANNIAVQLAGLFSGVEASDISDVNADNVQEGDNGSDLAQVANATSGDAVAGQVFGAVTTGATDAVLANSSLDSDTTSGDADETNEGISANGLVSGVIEV